MFIQQSHSGTQGEAGFSFIELLISMTIVVSVMSIAGSLLAQALKVRTRENTRTEALADAQRALNLMSREIANAGLGMKTNGIVWQDSNNNESIRVLADLDRYSGTPDYDVNDSSEDVKFYLTDNTNYLVRYDPHNPNPNLQTTILAQSVNSMKVYFFTGPVTYTTGTDCSQPVVFAAGVSPLTDANIAGARYIVIAVCVNLPAYGTPGAAGYQPQSQTLLASDVTLRNANLDQY
jgi:prepilin-type N-terminal cleavage/methylation domain-containing protein